MADCHFAPPICLPMRHDSHSRSIRPVALILTNLLLLGGTLLYFGCGGYPTSQPHMVSSAVLARHTEAGVRVFGRYRIVKLPIHSGVTIWNPAQVVRGPDDLMYVANHTGEIYSLRDTDGDGLEDEARLYHDVRADGLRSPAGLAFRGDELFVGTAQEIRVYSDRDGNGQADTSYTFLGNLPHSEHPYEWTSGLTFGPDGSLYAALATDSWNAGAAPDPEGWRGALLRIAPDGSAVERIATGLRSVPAMIFDDEGNLFFLDNQGSGNANEELNLATPGAFYGHNPQKYGRSDVTAAFLELLSDVVPSGMTFNPASNDFDGTAGDLFVSFYGPGERWTRGSIARVHFHRDENGELQAEEIPVLRDLPKISDLEFGPGGDLYATQMGMSDYWYQPLDEPDGAIYRIFFDASVEPDDLLEEEDAPAIASDDRLALGRQLFADLACSACHAVDGKTELLGPNLKDIGRIYSREELLEEIQEPSRRIKPSMAPTRITKADGEVLLGRVVS